MDRRDFIALLGTALLAPEAAPQAEEATMTEPHRIDVHHHIVPPSWLAAMDIIGRTDPRLAGWSVQKSLDDMAQGGVATAIASPTTPQVTPLGKDAAVRIARQSNEFAKRLMTDHAGRFGAFAMLPLPHIDESLAEAAYALDVLKLDGIGVMTNYGDKWLGYSYFAPLWEELNRRKATVYTHPTDASCCVNLVAGLHSSIVEWGADTTRTICDLIFSGTSRKYPGINWIFSHGGGVLTAIAERILVQAVSRPPYRGKFTRELVQGELDRFYYDTAQVTLAGTLAALAKLVPTTQICYGTDFPYRTAAEHSQGVAALFSGSDLGNIDRANALRILPRLART